MKNKSHESALPSHYDKAAEHYDAFNEENSRIINVTIVAILKKYNVHSVLDMTCGTGSQVFYLIDEGFDVIGSDINEKMLAIAREKAAIVELNNRLLQGDMRTLKVGTFDAVITIFNAVGHLTKKDFQTAMFNIAENVKDDGLYIFDIFNLSYLLDGNNITKLTIDWQEKAGGSLIRNVQYSTINQKGVLASYTVHLEQQKQQPLRATESIQTLQVYTADQLQDMLEKSGFTILQKSDVDGSPFHETETQRMLIMAQKKRA